LTAAGRLAGALLLASALAGCMPATTPAPTPIASPSASVEATAAALRDALAGDGFTLEPPGRDYRPAEPEPVQALPRAAFRVAGAAPGLGWVVIYDAGSPAAAAAAGADFGDYLAGGFGRTNYPIDARFHLARAGSALIFGWWSGQSSRAADEAGRAFELVETVGQPLETAP